MSRVTLDAPAKVNLHLEILGRRADGFHELETVFQTIGLCDTVSVALGPGEGIALDGDDPSLPWDASNLAWRAAAAYIAVNPLPGRASIQVAKRIPAGAGLGGGSADAAAVLNACDRLAARSLGPAALESLAASLGSDISFLIRGGTAHATGRGEVLTALPDLPALPLTVLMPEGAHCATPAVYRALTDVERGPRPARGATWFAERLPGRLLEILGNRLTPPACRVCPAVGDLLAHLAGLGVPHLMTGSGAACIAFAEVAAPPRVRAWPTRLRPATM